MMKSSGTVTRVKLIPVRRHGFPTLVKEPFWLFDDDSVLKAHHLYQQAKAGGKEAAVELISDLALEFLVNIKNMLPENAIFVVPHAREATGDNAIPQVLATACAMVTQSQVETDIVQITRVFHTGADPMERMSLRAEFDGAVIQGAQYILVDDVTNMGGTLAELANFLLERGGLVSAVVVLVNAGRAKHFHPARTTIKKLKERFYNEIEDIFSITPSALTANEANYLIGFKTADEIRNRLAKARKETCLRLRSKGIEQ